MLQPQQTGGSSDGRNEQAGEGSSAQAPDQKSTLISLFTEYINITCSATNLDNPSLLANNKIKDEWSYFRQLMLERPLNLGRVQAYLEMLEKSKSLHQSDKKGSSTTALPQNQLSLPTKPRGKNITLNIEIDDPPTLND